MSSTALPEDGPLQLGPVQLPPGRQIHAEGYTDGSVPAIAWVTSTRVERPGQVWSALSQISDDTGLVPVLAATVTYGSDRGVRPWADNIAPQGFGEPENVTLVDQLDASAFLKERWDSKVGPAEYAEDEDVSEDFAPFAREFPGLAPANGGQRDADHLQQVLESLPPSRIALAVAGRPADALPAMGWFPGNMYSGPLPVAAVLRSWEERFGARLLEVGLDEFRVLVQRPPRTLEAAQRIAAEMWALTDEVACAGKVGLSRISTIAPCLISTPIWGFWWD